MSDIKPTQDVGWVEGSIEPDTITPAPLTPAPGHDPVAGLAPTTTNPDGSIPVQTVVGEHIDQTRVRADEVNKVEGLLPENPGARADNVNQAASPPNDIHADAKRNERDRETDSEEASVRDPIEGDTVVYRGHDEANNVTDMLGRVLKVYKTSAGETPKVDVHLFNGRIHGERTITTSDGETIIVPNTERREVPFLPDTTTETEKTDAGWFWPIA